MVQLHLQNHQQIVGKRQDHLDEWEGFLWYGWKYGAPKWRHYTNVIWDCAQSYNKGMPMQCSSDHNLGKMWCS